MIVQDGYANDDALRHVVDYVRKTNKTLGDVGAQGTMLENPSIYMEKIKWDYYQIDGKNVQHFILAFSSADDISSLDPIELGYEVCALYPEYQFVFGVHHDTCLLHIHWAMNPVNMLTGKKFNFTHGETFNLRKEIAKLLEPYDIRCNLRTGDVTDDTRTAVKRDYSRRHRFHKWD